MPQRSKIAKIMPKRSPAGGASVAPTGSFFWPQALPIPAGRLGERDLERILLQRVLGLHGRLSGGATVVLNVRRASRRGSDLPPQL